METYILYRGNYRKLTHTVVLQCNTYQTIKLQTFNLILFASTIYDVSVISRFITSEVKKISCKDFQRLFEYCLCDTKSYQ